MSESTKNDRPINIGAITTYQSGIVQASAHRLINREMAHFLLPYDLSCMQWFMIGHIYDAGSEGVRLTDLMRLLDTKLPFITNSINLLESRGIVEKRGHETDNRVKLVSIAPSYRKTVQVIEAHLREELRHLLYDNDDISREELSAYITVLYKMINAVGKN